MHRLRAVALAPILAASIAAAPAHAGAAAAPRWTPQPDPQIGPDAQQMREHPDVSLSPDGGAAALAAVRSAVRSSAAQPRLSREVFGFAPYWELSDWPEWRMADLTTISYFGITITSTGGIAQDSGLTGWNSADLHNLVAAAHTAGDRVNVTVESMDDADINSIVNNATYGQNAINNAINLMRSAGLDGITVDFEGSTNPAYPNIQQGFTNWMGNLTRQAHAARPGSEIVAATYSGSASWTGGMFNIGALSPNVDAFFDMAYDMYAGNSSCCASANAPLNGWTYNDTLSVQQYLSQTQPGKLLLGVPYYGYKWSVTSPVANATTTSGAQSDTYSGIFGDFACAQSLGQHWDPTAASPWSTWYSPASGDPCHSNLGTWRELYWDNPTSLGMKYDLVNYSGIRGMGIWALGYDAGRGELWDEITAKFSGSIPAATMTALPSTESSRQFSLQWGPQAGSAPVLTYTVWYTDDGGVWLPWTTSAATSAVFTGLPSHTYHFYVQASNGAGSSAPPMLNNGGQASTTVSSSAPSLGLPFGGLYSLDTLGDVNGGSSAPLSPEMTPFGWNIARGIAVQRGGRGGYVLDGFGGVHSIGAAPAVSVTGYWPGWDIARSIALLPNGTSGYVLDGWGGLHPFGGAPSPGSQASHYWPGWDIARQVVLLPGGGGGYILDGFGGLHAFGGAPDPGPQSTHYWPNWTIARGVSLDAGGGGYVLDGFGGLHPFGGAPPVDVTGHYWPGWDIARAVAGLPSTTGSGYVVDAQGGMHAFGSAPAVYAATPYFSLQAVHAAAIG